MDAGASLGGGHQAVDVLIGGGGPERIPQLENEIVQLGVYRADELLDLFHPHAYVLDQLLVLFVDQHPSPGHPYYHLFRGGEDGVEQQNLMADVEVVEGASQGGSPI